MSDPPPSRPAALPKGASIAEYEIVRVLGAGGFGITYLAFDHQLDGPVAIKEYFPAELATRVDGDHVAATATTNRETFAWGLQRFVDEARAVHRFRHPNVVRAYRYLEAHGTAYLVMEYVEGESLKSILDRRGSLSTEEWRPWMDALLDGLEHVHSHGFLHRDVKPANIVIRSDDSEPVLIDFGSARLQHRDRTHTQVLSAVYAPIEQHSTGASQGTTTDIYALAATSYRALTGTPVSSAPDRILDDDYESLADRVGGTDGQWLAAIDHGLAVRPQNRPQTVEDWRTELAGTAASRSTVAHTELGTAPPKSSTDLPETAEPTIRTGTQPTRASFDTPPRLARRRPAVAALGALLLLGVAALSVVLLTKDISPGSTLESEPSLETPGPAVAADTDTADPPPEAEEETLGSFRVVAEPSSSRVEFLNGEASYVPGMPLPPGQYRVRVSAPGHRSSETGIEHGASSTVLRVNLTAEAAVSGDSELSSPSPQVAEENDADTQFRLGETHYYGIGTAQDHGAAVEHYQKAADQGHPEAQFMLGYMLYHHRLFDYFVFDGEPDKSEGVAWLRKAADQGYAAAQREAADEGNPVAQFNLGVLSEVGVGVTDDDGEAAAWFRKAADQGLAKAQFHLGDLYARGVGVPRNSGEALAWYQRAADQGDANAHWEIGQMFYWGEGVPRNYRLATDRYSDAAAQGSAHAARFLGYLHAYKSDWPRDYVQAYAWFAIAAERGDEGAKEDMHNIGRELTSVQIAEARRLIRELVSQ